MNQRTEETKVARKALEAAGYTVRHVGHGTGTARWWLHAQVAALPGDSWYEAMTKATAIIQDATGRSGKYDGCINVDVS